jgi:hypothetical protein
MTQLSCEVPEPLARRVEEKAGEVHLSVSEYLAKLIERDVAEGWPEGYFEKVIGSWQGDLERPEQIDNEQRESLE